VVSQIQPPQKFAVLREVYVFGNSGRKALQCISPGEVVVVSSRAKHKRMYEVIWQKDHSTVFERDLLDRMEPFKKPDSEEIPRPR